MRITPRSLILSPPHGYHCSTPKCTYANHYVIKRNISTVSRMSKSLKAPPGNFTVLYFASASSYTSKDSEAFPAPLPLSKLFDTLEERYNGMKAKVLESCLVTVNLEYVDVLKKATTEDEATIEAGDEVAIIPPVSSG
jgi:molybdopterin converting factor small subunit